MSIRFRAADERAGEREGERADRAPANAASEVEPSSLPVSVAAPVQRDQELELPIDSLAFGGNGVARLDGFVVFVRRGLPGDTVRARVTKVQRRHAEAITTEVLTPGPQRVEAPCAHYPACGGCRFQDLAYEIAARDEAAVGRATRCSGSPASPTPPLEPIVPAASQFHYRNKMEYSFTQTQDGPTLGLHSAGRWDEVLEIDKCWLTTDLGNAIRNRMRDWAREEKLHGLRPGDARGLPAPPRRSARGATPARRSSSS